MSGARRRPLRRGAVLLAALLSTAGCGVAPGDGACPEEGAPSVEVGTGVYAFEAIAANGGVPIVEGPQGGYHVWMGVRVHGMGPRITVQYGARDADTGELLTRAGLQRTIVLDGSGEEVAGLAGLFAGGDPRAYVGRRAILWAAAGDDCHAPVRSEIEATLLAPEL